MGWSYSGDPSKSTLDEVRFLIGDTDEDRPLLQDAEITYELAQQRDVYEAAAFCCEAIAAQSRRLVNKTVGPLSISIANRATAYDTQAKAMHARAFRAGLQPTPYVGGISLDDKQTDQENDDIEEYIRVGMFDNPSTLGTSGDPRLTGRQE